MADRNQPQERLRVGVVGARRGRQGIGEHVAWRLARLGAEVPAIVGTTSASVAEAQRNLRDRHGLETRGYLSLPAMLRAERLDAVAICSPNQCHREQLQIALDNGLHALCEKPLVFEAAGGSADVARPLVDGFFSAGKTLMVNEQWPYTLPWFRRLLPPGEGAVARSLAMLLCPAETGAAMIPNALPHLLSLLLAVAPAGGTARDIEVAGDDPRELHVRFQYDAGDDVSMETNAIAVHALFRQALEQPRPAGYSIDGRAARRTIDMADYSMALEAVQDLFAEPLAVGNPTSSRRIAIPDPLELLLKDFLARIAPGLPTKHDATLLDRLRLLDEVHRAVVEQLAAPSRPPAPCAAV